MALNARQRKFVQVFAGNGADACRLAGYNGSVQALSTQAARLLRNAEVAEAIAKRSKKEDLGPVIADRQGRQKFWTSIMGDVDAELAQRLRASELLGKSEADFTENLRHEGASVSFVFNRGRRK